MLFCYVLGNHGQTEHSRSTAVPMTVIGQKNAILNQKRTLGNRINRLLLISKHKSSQKINLSDSENTENDVPVEEKKKTQNIFDKRLTVDEIDEISIEDIEKGVTQALIKIFLGPQNATLTLIR